MLRTLAEQYKTRIFCAGELEEKQIFYAERGMLKDSGDVQGECH